MISALQKKHHPQSNCSTLQNILKQTNVGNPEDEVKSPSGKRKAHLLPIQMVKGGMSQPQRANNYMPKKPADVWQQSYEDGRITGYHMDALVKKPQHSPLNKTFLDKLQ